MRGRGRSASWFSDRRARPLPGVAEWEAGVERGGDERMPQRVRAELLDQPGTASHATHDPPHATTVHASTVGAEKDRPRHAFADRRVDTPGGPHCERDRDDLAALTQHRHRAVTAFAAQRGDVCAAPR